jgi:hypothetical protein
MRCPFTTPITPYPEFDKKLHGPLLGFQLVSTNDYLINYPHSDLVSEVLLNIVNIFFQYDAVKYCETPPFDKR